MKRVHQIWSWYEVFIEHRPIGTNILFLNIKNEPSEKQSHEIGSTKYVPGMKKLTSTVQ